MLTLKKRCSLSTAPPFLDCQLHNCRLDKHFAGLVTLLGEDVDVQGIGIIQGIQLVSECGGSCLDQRFDLLLAFNYLVNCLFFNFIISDKQFFNCRQIVIYKFS